MKFLSRLLASYDYASFKDFLYSVFPSWKYHMQVFSLSLSAIAAFFDYLFGFGIGLGFAMLIAVVLEIKTGIQASAKQKHNFESFKFSRCIIKLSLWLLIFYIIHAFEKEYREREHVMDIVTHLFFKSLFIGAMTLFCIEHITSILENYAVLDGKPKTQYINFIKDSWKNLLEFLKNKIA